MKQLREWMTTLSLAGLALAALVYVLVVPEAQAEENETTQYTECVYLHVRSVAAFGGSLRAKPRVFAPELAERAAPIPEGWTPVGGGGGTFNGIVLCR